jgi:CRISPR/Cas system type I-B associated protein Csh2 (Cas7 group RAMP superfamily)
VKWLLVLLLPLYGCGDIATIGVDTGFTQEDIQGLKQQVVTLQKSLNSLLKQNDDLIKQLNKCTNGSI